MELYDKREICCSPVYPKQDSVIYTPLLSYINAREAEELNLLSPSPRLLLPQRSHRPKERTAFFFLHSHIISIILLIKIYNILEN